MAEPVTGDRLPGAARREGAPGVARTWRASRRTSSRSRASTTCTRSRRSAGWTRCWSTTSWSSTTWSRGRASTCGSATRPGTSTTSCTRTRELKRAPFVWMTDFVGWMPMADGGEREAFLAADYNAEMVEHVARFPSLRDRSVFVGDPADVVDLPLGPGPAGRPRVDQGALRVHRLRDGRTTRSGRNGRPCAHVSATPSDDVVCLVSVGGSGVGTHLLRRVAASYDEARRADPQPEDDHRHRTPHRPGARSPRRPVSRCTASCPTSTCTTRPATSPSCRAG